MLSRISTVDVPLIPLAHQELDGFRGQGAVFDDIFLVFVILGTLVGMVVVGYMIYNAYKYREAATPEEAFDPPTLGELPTGGAGGRKLFLSFAISAIIVIGLVAWTYTALLYVEQGATQDVETEYDIAIEGVQWGWSVEYPNGESTFNEVYLPADTMVGMEVTSTDVWHTFGISELRIKVDAIPGQTAESWILVDETGEYLAECFELCGAGHSTMEADVFVLEQAEWEDRFAGNESDGDTERIDGEIDVDPDDDTAEEPPLTATRPPSLT